MNISQPTDWYKVKREDVYKHGGQKLIEQYYGNSLYKVIFAGCTSWNVIVGFDSFISSFRNIPLDFWGEYTPGLLG